MKTGAAGRLARVLYAPVETFRELKENPTWVLGFFVLWGIAVALWILVISRVDFADAVRAQLEAQGQQVPSNLEESAKFFRGCSIVGAIAGPPIVTLIVAAVFMVFNLVGGELDYRKSLAITVHASMPRALFALLALPVVVSRESLTLEEMQSSSFLHSNLGVFAPADAAPWLLTLLGSFDVFALATLALFAVGYHVAGSVPRGKAIAWVLGLWGTAVAIQVGLAALRTAG